MNTDKWSKKEITKELRKMNKDKLGKEIKEERCCEICKCKEGVQNHHIIKVENLSKIAYYKKFENIEEMYIPTVDLCDYHHKVWHGCTGDTNYLDTEISVDDFYRIVDILGNVDLTKAPKELYDDYKKYFEEIVDAFMFELKEHYSFTDSEIDDIKEALLVSEDYSAEEMAELLGDDYEDNEFYFDDCELEEEQEK